VLHRDCRKDYHSKRGGESYKTIPIILNLLYTSDRIEPHLIIILFCHIMEHKNTAPDILACICNSIPVESDLRYCKSTDRERILETLNGLSNEHPELRDLSESIFRHEALSILSLAPATSPERVSGDLRSQLEALPDLSKFEFPKGSLEADELFQLEHDLAGPLQFIFGQEKNFSESHFLFYKSLDHFSKLRWRYAGIQDDLQLSDAYSELVRKYCQFVLIPNATSAIEDKLSIGNYEFYQARSVYRELAGLDPKSFAEEFPLRTTVEKFIGERKFHDKRLERLVEVVVDTSSEDPFVYIDKGDLYRMINNLLIDAVAYGEGTVIKPAILIEELNDHVSLSIFSPGALEKKVLEVIGKIPYTTSDEDSKSHGYGKVGARKLLETLWASLGKTKERIDELFENHWSNTTYQKKPHVRWNAPIPIAAHA